MSAKGWGSAKRASFIKDVFGARAGTGANAIWDAVLSGSLEELTQKYIHEQDGAVRRMADKMNATAKGSLTQLGSALESVGIDLGNVLLPPLAETAKGLASIVGSVSELLQKYPGVTKWVVGLGAGFVGLKAATLATRIGFPGEIEIALVMRRDSHNRAGSIPHQDVVSDPDRDPFPIDWVDRVGTGEDAGLLPPFRFALDVRLPRCFFDIGVDRRLLRLGCELPDQRMFRGKDHERRAPERIGSRRENDERVAGFGFERHGRAFRSADPVRLKRSNAFRPVHPGKIEELIGVLGRPEVPLIQVFLDNRRSAAFAMPIVTPDLFPGERRVARGAPVDRREFLIRQPVFQQLNEKPLRPAVILRFRADNLTAPVKHAAHRFKLIAHVVDIFKRPFCRVDIMLDGGVFGGEPERVEPHRK